MKKRLARIDQIVSSKSRIGLVPVSHATWWRWVAKGLAPQPIKLGPNTTAWDLDEVDAWLELQARKEGA
jgi:prophage regulatory protein